ncbi:LapA family protein [Actinomycetospora straminea]|uniref:Integral membrane protein n=1 Tax=Actinomycetospora straminea TaxID=663607 RepID=A0ABP9F5C8_9PSEU|nr:LapA family protein [Actinomycetospora straminea]MDD7936148.1 LapA family protein [Actinomycetospora straminea]
MTDTPPRSAPRPASATPWWRARWVLPAVLAVLVVVFILENRDLVTIRLLIPVVVMPQWAALTITLVIGLVIGLMLRRRRR